MNTLSKFSEKSIIFLLFLVAFGPILDKFIGFKFENFSFFITVFPFLILLLIYLINFRRLKIAYHLLLGINIIFFWLIILLRSAFYGEFSLKIFGSDTYVFFIPICIILFTNLRISKKYRSILLYLLMTILLFNFLIALLYILGLPTIQMANINNPDYIEFGRFTGMMGGSNVQGNFIYTIFMILILASFSSNIYINFILFVISLLAVFPTLSKNAILGVIFVFLYSIYEYLRTNKILSKMKLAIISILITTFFIFYIDLTFIDTYFDSFETRLIGEKIYEGRIEKLDFAFSNLFSNFTHMFCGIPSTLQGNSSISISDNSLTLFLANFGIPYFIFFLFSIIYLIKDKIKSRKNMALYTILILIILLTNNSVLWLPWILFTFLGYSLLKKNNNIIQSA